jgi:hypothetical protein
MAPPAARPRSTAGLPDETTFQCPNCESASDGRYCGACGQKRPDDSDLSARHAARYVVEELLDVDGRVLGTVRLLFARPWQLTLDFLEGRRVRHVHPLRLFLVFGAVFFLVRASTLTTVFEGNLGARVTAGMQAQAQQEGVSFETVVARNDQRLALIYKSAYIAGSLLSGLWLWLFFRRDYPYFAQHMVTALYLSCIGMAAILVADVLQGMVTGRAGNPTAVGGGRIGTLALVVLALYSGKTLEHVYLRGRKGVSIKFRFANVNLLALVSTMVLPQAVVSRYLHSLIR